MQIELYFYMNYCINGGKAVNTVPDSQDSLLLEARRIFYGTQLGQFMCLLLMLLVTGKKKTWARSYFFVCHSTTVLTILYYTNLLTLCTNIFQSQHGVSPVVKQLR